MAEGLMWLIITNYFLLFRAVKSVLVMAGSLKRENPDKREDVVLIRALRDSNLPKFLSDDALLFQVFPLHFTFDINLRRNFNSLYFRAF